MSYSTGSGSYIDLMAAVLAHALGDGWVEAGGLGTGWPIKNGTTFVDWDSYTFSASDFTIGGDGTNKTQRMLRIGLGETAAEATANRTTDHCPNFAYTFSEWHIFSEPALCNYISVVGVFSNGVDPVCCAHFSFGELDQGGMTHGGILFAGGQDGRAWAENTDSYYGGRWGRLNKTGYAFAGSVGEGDESDSNLSIYVKTANHPLPSPGPGVGWPNVATQINDGASVWTMSRPNFNGSGSTAAIPANNSEINMALNWQPVGFQPQPFVGSVSLAPLPIFITNGSSSGSRMIYAGQIPNVRICSMTGFTTGDEVKFGSETWKLFPMIVAKDNATLWNGATVTSGSAGYAYKKVV